MPTKPWSYFTYKDTLSTIPTRFQSKQLDNNLILWTTSSYIVDGFQNASFYKILQWFDYETFMKWFVYFQR